MRLVKFGSRSCGPCRAMDRSKVLERFVAKHSDITLERVDIETEKGGELADVYDITAIPVVVFETEEGGELARDEGGQTMQTLEELLSRAKIRLKKRAQPHEAADSDLTSGEAHES